MAGIKRDKLDILFSEFIRCRDRGICQRCLKYFGWKRLQTSHFHGRSKKSTRWDPDNACGLCFGCHQHLGSRPLEHVEFFKKRLGELAFDLLNSRARTPQRYIDKSAIELYLKVKLKELDE